MNKQELAALGFTEEDVINKLVDRLLESRDEDDYTSELGSCVEKAVRAKIDERLNVAFAEHVLPKVAQMVDGICLQETNTWGEKIGSPLTFTEYLTQRADVYIREPVDYNGKPKAQDPYNWSAHTTRISHMIHEHLHYSVEKTMKDALGLANKSVAKGLAEAVELALKQVKVTVDTKVTT